VKALLRDLGLDDGSGTFVKNILTQTTDSDPLAAFESFDAVDDIHLSPGGVTCLIAYWIFSTDVFNADNPDPEMHLFPEHLAMVERFLGPEPQAEINSNPGIADALLAIGLGLHHRGLVSTTGEPSYMAYHHRLTLISVFHPHIQVRNAATMFAGTLLHSDPDDENRLDILEDLLENCQFAALKACAVKWLQEEIIAAQKDNVSNQFSKSEVIEGLQYTIFPDMLSVGDMDSETLLEFWIENQAFLLQTVNFAYFLFKGRKDLVPVGMSAAVEERFSEPLITAASKIEQIEGLDAHDRMQLNILIDRLQSSR
jgi:hypothetical protein